MPVVLNGDNFDFLVDTGGVSASLSKHEAATLKLDTGYVNRPLQGVAGIALDHATTIAKFNLGRLEGANIPVYIDPRIPENAGMDGTLSADMMKRYDVDIDLLRGTLSLFSQDHCPGQVVHWTRSGFVVLPMAVALTGHVKVPVSLDGKVYTALLDTGAQFSIMSMRAAKALGISPTSPDLKLVTSGQTGYKLYEYPFKLLDFDGVAVSKPRVLVGSDDFLPGRDTEMVIGVSLLRRLHLYIAYGEQKLYITPAGAN